MDNELKILLFSIQEAGKTILDTQRKGLEITKKKNNDFLTQADLQADAILKNQLLSQFPQDGWLSEETTDDPRRLACERVWVVDPIDGTKEFVQGFPEFAVSVALVEKGIPILAAVFNPAKNELFHAVKDKGAWLNHEKIHCSDVSKLILVSRSEYERGEWKHFEGDFTLKEMGSIAYKLALVAAGKAAASITYHPRSEWDIAAGVLLVQEAGGWVSNKINKPFLFNQTHILVDGVIASASQTGWEKLFSLKDYRWNDH